MRKAIFFTLFFSLILFWLFPGCDFVGEQFPDLTRILSDEPPLTTSLKNANRDIPFLDGFNPENDGSLFELERSSAGGFFLPNGVYGGALQSYCLKAGTHEPGVGRGMVYAPYIGSQASAIQSILRNSVSHPNIPQRQVQTLIWAVLSRARFENLSRDNQAAAARLLSPQEIVRLNRNAVDVFPERIRQQAIGQVPASVFQVLEVENNMRELLTRAETTYEELERIAFLTGEVPWGEGSREVPGGRWSYHPGGYYVRYNTRGYSRTEVQVFHPEPMFIERDQLGRIGAISDTRGNRLEIFYDDTVVPAQVPDDPGLTAYAFDYFVAIRPNDQFPGGIERVEFVLEGWTYVGVPGALNQQAQKSLFFQLVSSLSNRVLAQGWRETWEQIQSRFPGAKDRYDQIKGSKEWYDDFRENYETPPSWQDVENLYDSEHLDKGIEAATDPTAIKQRTRWIEEHLGRVKRAWAYVNCRLAGGCNNGDTGNGETEFDPADNIAVPGNTASQRIGVSGRGS